MSNTATSRAVYSTVTKGHGDLTAARAHRITVARMVHAANRTHYATCPTKAGWPTRAGGLNCTCPALDDSGLPY